LRRRAARRSPWAMLRSSGRRIPKLRLEGQPQEPRIVPRTPLGSRSVTLAGRVGRA
jgi:hypothetical protein